MKDLKITEIYKNYDIDKEQYQVFHYTLGNSKFEYWINVHKDGILFCNDIKLDTLITTKQYLEILENEDKRLDFMKDLIISIENNTLKPYETRCKTIVDSKAFNIDDWTISYKDALVEAEDFPYHADNVELVLLEYNQVDNTVTVFDYITKCLYISTIVDNIFEVNNTPYSINLFEIYEDIISIQDFRTSI